MAYLLDQTMSTRELYPLEEYIPEPYTPKAYVVPNNIMKTHSRPRFGKPNSFDALVDGDSTDYILGCVSMLPLLTVLLICRNRPKGQGATCPDMPLNPEATH